MIDGPAVRVMMGGPAVRVMIDGPAVSDVRWTGSESDDRWTGSASDGGWTGRCSGHHRVTRDQTTETHSAESFKTLPVKEPSADCRGGKMAGEDGAER